MPYPSEHAARVKDPGLFDPNSFRSKDLKGGVRLILGKLKGEDTMTAQAFRFSIEQFTEEEARKWLKDHKISFIKFEPAKKDGTMEEKTLQHVGVMGMRWGHRKSETMSQRLVREAHPKKWSTGKKIAVGTGLAAGILLTPWPVGLTVAVASNTYFAHKAATQRRAQLALAKMGKTKIKNLPKKSAYEDFQEGLKKLHDSGKGNNDKAVIALSEKYDKARKAEKELYRSSS